MYVFYKQDYNREGEGYIMIALATLIGALLIIVSLYKFHVSDEKKAEAIIILSFGIGIILFTLFFVYVTENIFK